MGTVRIGPINQSGPSTAFYMEADWVRQEGNASILGVWLRAVNTGNTSSNFLNAGVQRTWWGGGEFMRHQAQPFLPGGVGNGGTRWHDYTEHRFEHDANGFLGGIAFGMGLSYGNVNGEWYGSIDAPPRIPKAPGAVDWMTLSDVLPTSLRVDWGGGAATNGAGLDAYLVRWSTSASFAGYQDVLVPANEFSKTLTDLLPGTRYYVAVYAHNAVGFGPATVRDVETLAGGRAWDGSAFRNCRVRVWNGSAWQLARVRTWNGSAWVNSR